MTYCVALRVEAGIVMLSDTRTNAGLGAIALLCSGNLSVTQEVKAKISRAIKDSAENPETETILNCATLHRAAHIVGEAMKAVQNEIREGMSASDISLGASIIVAGQRKGGKPRLYMVYSEGNFIEATADTPFFQIGEHKYGKPILDRMIKPDTSLSDAAKAVCVSMDSTLRSNLSVGMPLDLLAVARDSFTPLHEKRIEKDDPYFLSISSMWGDSLKEAVHALPDYSFKN